ncbi:MAG: hypothetical protein M1821_008412 [Bathelium mastoideum]|nr:MAG: hypothetical protein M1821_008412 [Bathelium mastoideum]
MRLLQRLSNGTLRLTSNNLKEGGYPYAILSHTWGTEAEEVTFEDVVEQSGQSKAGYAKIRFCGEQAARDGLRWLWVDSCCIKTSSDSELSESLNSMFRWYQRATKCYVFLSDVSIGLQSPGLSWKSAFRKSRWFTRGWTLLELLAPSSVEFFSREGQRLGDKQSLERQIHEITGIPTGALRGEPLSGFTINERLSWAKDRCTARVEDLAYSLLGIFDISMPPLYGEGGRNAFRRLYNRILEDSELSPPVDAPLNHVTDSGYGGSGASNAQSYAKLLIGSPTALVEIIPESEAEPASHDSQTAYSDTEILRQLELLDHVTTFADELYRLLSSNFDKAGFERVLPFFNELLQTFAFKLSYDGSTPDHRNLMYLAHRYRSKISESLRQRYNDDFAQRELPIPTGHDDMTVEEKLGLQESANVSPREDTDADSGGIPQDGSDDTTDNDSAMDSTRLPGLETYREIIKQSSSYQWLLWQIAAANKLECPGPVNTQKTIRDHILTSVHKLSSRGKSPKVHIMYHPQWDLSIFHAEQGYSCSVDQVLSQAITITGYRNDVQATTCSQYINQTWGEMGSRLLQILQQAIVDSPNMARSPSGSKSEYSSAQLSFWARYADGEFVVLASGIPYLVAEVGELLAWLGASFRSSPNSQGPISCMPLIAIQAQSTSPPPGPSTDRAEVVGNCMIKFRFQTVSKSDLGGLSGSCWLDLFRNPVLVEGYPIPRRSRVGSGLETNIDIMASLSNAKYLVDFGRRTFLKGFSRMLVVTKIIGSTVFWHLFYNQDGAYISYEDARVPRLQENDATQTLEMMKLATSRHILGWCEKVSCDAGKRNANYNISWSKLCRPRNSFAFDKVSITAGKYINVGTSMSIGIKDKPEHVSFDDDYLSTLDMISERHFVLYDNIDRRVWLLDGASVLLHLLRAFIKHSQTNSRLKDFFILEDGELVEANESQEGGEAAFYVLANEYNQSLPLWPKTAAPTEEKTMKLGSEERPEETIKYQKAYFCLKDRVLQICRILQQILAHQDDVYTRDGVGARIKLTPRRQLEGFDFMDVATNQGTLWPKVDCIQAWGEGWVDLTRKLHCVALFGTGFGQLMKPIGKPCQLCMSNIPQGPDLLGITTADLLNIIEKRGENHRLPWRIVENIYCFWSLAGVTLSSPPDATEFKSSSQPLTQSYGVQVYEALN